MGVILPALSVELQEKKRFEFEIRKRPSVELGDLWEIQECLLRWCAPSQIGFSFNLAVLHTRSEF